MGGLEPPIQRAKHNIEIVESANLDGRASPAMER
jgi:hypothetical protein